jgi:DNA-binding response OmpR family regulator
MVFSTCCARTKPPWKHPFIFLTAKTERADFRKGMEMGADDYITKPFDDIELFNAIEIRLKKNDIIHAKYSGDERGASELIAHSAPRAYLRLNAERRDAGADKKMFLYQEGKRPKWSIPGKERQDQGLPHQ